MNNTSIQWAHSTVNPLMGCLGCELFPQPEALLEAIDQGIARVVPAWKAGDAREAFGRFIQQAWTSIDTRVPGHSRAVSTTNIVHVAESVAGELEARHGAPAGRAVRDAIDGSVVCYAAKLHLNRATSITAPQRKVNPGYAATFERMRSYPGRAASMARAKDLLGTCDPHKPWADGLPRLVFVGDMGDTFARHSDFGFVALDVMPAITSEEGRRHLWLLLSKRPQRMAEFARIHGAFPRNVCCMTTVTSMDTLDRLDDLRSIDCAMRGVSGEPLWERLPEDRLNLEGIDWFIAGGASGARKDAKPFDLAWAREVQERCRKSGTAFFLKQLGSNPVQDGRPFKCLDRHGGDWNEWPEDLRVRQFPESFRSYRRKEARP